MCCIRIKEGVYAVKEGGRECNAKTVFGLSTDTEACCAHHREAAHALVLNLGLKVMQKVQVAPDCWLYTQTKFLFHVHIRKTFAHA